MSDDDAPLPRIGPEIDAIDPRERAQLIAEIDTRDIVYPFGSGQGDELALRAGLRPMIRELLHDHELEPARQRLEGAGFICEIAERRYGPTHDGWDDTPDPARVDPAQLRRALFIGRDRQRLRDAVACDLAKTDEGDRDLGRLLGYPRCCVEAFVGSSSQRKNVALLESAQLATEGQPLARLNVLDLAVFHLISWYPCSFRCEWSARYANALAERIARVALVFMSAIDTALSRHRLVLHDQVQLSIEGVPDNGSLRIDRVRPTTRDRHPRATLDEPSREALARALYRLRTVRDLRVDDGVLLLDGERVSLPNRALLVPFGQRS